MLTEFDGIEILDDCDVPKSREARMQEAFERSKRSYASEQIFTDIGVSTQLRHLHQIHLHLNTHACDLFNLSSTLGYWIDRPQLQQITTKNRVINLDHLEYPMNTIRQFCVCASGV